MNALSTIRQALEGRYAIDRELGRGGMGIVYLAEDLKHARKVAIKVLRPELASMVTSQRFLREIRFVAQFQHPHIVPLYDSGEADDLLYFVMPFIEGETLRDRIARDGQLSIEEALRITREVALALDYAHARGVVHRDVKPANILITSGTALIADFGIARAVSAATDERSTESSLVLGTPLYMSPEQSRDTPLTGSADQYSLACVLYEMLTGAPPFGGASATTVVARHAMEPAPDIRLARETVPDGVAEAIGRAMSKDPSDRFATATEFADAAITARVSQSQPVAVVSPPSRRRTLTMAAGALGLLGVAAIAASIVIPRGARPATAALAADGASLPRIAVIRTNVASADTTFAGDLAAELNERLGSIGGLRVISRSSASAYDRQPRPVVAAARDLGLNYALTMSVQPRTSSDGGRVSQVRVELQDAGGVQLWTSSYRVRMDPSSIYDAQASIASGVASALAIKLADAERAAINARPTTSFAAYERFLRGNMLALRLRDVVALDAAIHEYEAAVAQDRNFALAFAKLSQVQSVLYYDTKKADTSLKRRAWENAMAAQALAPAASATQLALGAYYYRVEGNLDSATIHLELAQSAEPNNPDLHSLRGNILRTRGAWSEGLEAARQAAALDPRSARYAFDVGTSYMWLRRYAQADSALRQATALDPLYVAPFLSRALVQALWKGDSAAMNAVMSQATRPPSNLTTAQILSNIIPRFRNFLAHLGEPWQTAMERASMSELSNVSLGTFYLAKAEMHARAAGDVERADRGRHASLARAYFDSARVIYEPRTHPAARPASSDPNDHMDLGSAYAGLGRAADGIREGREALAMGPAMRDSTLHAYLALSMLRIYVRAGANNEALDLLEGQLRGHGLVSRVELPIMPDLKPLANEPRYRALIGQTP